MSVPFLLIDGYNLLHAAGLARTRYAPGDLQRARHRLLALLCEKLTTIEQMRCTVVFDARGNLHLEARESRHHDITVLFTPPQFEADDLIEQLIAQHPAPKQLVVVSADHRLHQAAHRRHARPLDSHQFWEQLQTRPDARQAWQAPPPPPPEKPPATSQATELWLAEFGTISVDQLAAEVRAEQPAAPPADAWTRHLLELEQTLNDPERRQRFLDSEPRRRAGRKHPGN